jgi:hypothetical protein
MSHPGRSLGSYRRAYGRIPNGAVSTQLLLDGRQLLRQNICVHGFHQVSVEAGGICLAVVLRTAKSGYRNHGDPVAPNALPDLAAGFKSIHPGHRKVKQHNVRDEIVGQWPSYAIRLS